MSNPNKRKQLKDTQRPEIRFVHGECKQKIQVRKGETHTRKTETNTSMMTNYERETGSNIELILEVLKERK